MRRGPGERLRAWLYTGPLGHFWSTAADVAAFAVTSLAGRLRGRRRDRSQQGIGGSTQG